MAGRQFGRMEIQTEFLKKHLNVMTAEEKLKQFSELEEGWRFGRGVKFATEVINRSIDLARLGVELKYVVDAFPGANGEILLDFGEIEVIVEAGSYILIVKLGSDEATFYNTPLEEIIRKLKNEK